MLRNTVKLIICAAFVTRVSICTLPENAVIYVDSKNETNDPTVTEVLNGGINLPCKDNEVSNKGELHVNASVQPVIPAKTCQQTWTYSFNGTCHCGHTIHRAVGCENNRVSILDCNCMTYEEECDTTVVGACPYGCGFSSVISSWSGRVYSPLPVNISKLNDAMCGRLNRDGRLCSKCKKDFSPLVYTYDYNCIRCPNSRRNWWKFIAIAFIPLTVFYFIVILFRINATNPYLYGFITLNQALGFPINLQSVLIKLEGSYKLATRIIAIPYTIWNFDYFRSLPLNICLDLTTLQTLALDYAIAIYPLILIAITYTVIELHARGCRVLVWLWRPFNRCCV